MIRKTILISTLIIFISGIVPGENNDKNKIGVPLVQFIPGITQLKEGKVIKGGILLGVFLATIAGAIIKNSQGNEYYDQYLESIVVEDIVELRKKAENCYRMRNYFIMGIFTVWVIHLLDLKFFKKKGGVKGEIKNNSIRFGFYFSF